MAAGIRRVDTSTGASGAVRFDPLRAFVFPNNLRSARRAAGFPKLLQLAQRVPEIPYIRLSKIERGEVFARADELKRLADLLGIAAADLLIDTEDPAFDLTRWAAPFVDPDTLDPEEEGFAVLLGAALHLRRAQDRSLSVARLTEEFGLPPVIVSRLENAAKPLDRWNDHVLSSLCRIFGVRSVPALRRAVHALHEAGALDVYLDRVANPAYREAKTRDRIRELRQQVDRLDGETPPSPAPAPLPSETVTLRLLPVLGLPLPDGLVAPLATGETVPAPAKAGPRAYALRTGPPTLGGGMPANAVLIVDPDRFPAAGGLAVVTEGANRRLVSVAVDRHGAMKGYSENPDREVPIDALDPALVAAVVAALFD